jgi:hypothetical protein
VPKTADIEEVTLRLGADLSPQELNPSPSTVRRWGIRNILSYSISILGGIVKGRYKLLAVRDDGVLFVSDLGAGYTEYIVRSGTTSGSYTGDNTFIFDKVYGRYDVFLFDANAYVSFYDGYRGQWKDDILLLRGIVSLDIAAQGIRLKSEDANVPTRYQVVVWGV